MKRLKEGVSIDGCRYKLSKPQNGIKRQIWSIKHTVAGKRINEGLGAITQATALDIARQLRENKATNKKNSGKGIAPLPETVREMKEELAREKQLEVVREQEQAAADVTFRDFFARFVSIRENGGRPDNEIQKYRARYEKWIHPVMGHVKASEVSTFDLQRIIAKMDKSGAAPSTIVKVVGIISHAYSSTGTYKNPVVRKRIFEMRPDIKDAAKNNNRRRYLTREEAQQLLDELPEQLSIMSMLSIGCGFRASELFKMTWGDVDFSKKRIHVPETKNGEPRTVSMGQSISDTLESMGPGKRNQLIFPSPGGQYTEIPRVFRDTVKKLGFNDDIADPRDKVVFHSLRHTCGSWMVDAGIDLFTVQKVMGHKSISTTQRYVHSTGQLETAAKVFDSVLSAGKEPALEVI